MAIGEAEAKTEYRGGYRSVGRMRLREAIPLVARVCSGDVRRGLLQGIGVRRYGEEEWALAATDTYRLTLATSCLGLDVSVEADEERVLAGTAIKSVLAACNPKARQAGRNRWGQSAWSQGEVFAQLEQAAGSAPSEGWPWAEGVFPNYQKIIPWGVPLVVTFTPNEEHLRQVEALVAYWGGKKECAKLHSEASMGLRWTQEYLSVCSARWSEREAWRRGVGDGVSGCAQLGCNPAGTAGDFAWCCNPWYWLEVLRLAGEAEVKMYWQMGEYGPGPARFEFERWPGVVHVLMPSPFAQ